MKQSNCYSFSAVQILRERHLNQCKLRLYALPILQRFFHITEKSLLWITSYCFLQKPLIWKQNIRNKILKGGRILIVFCCAENLSSSASIHSSRNSLSQVSLTKKAIQSKHVYVSYSQSSRTLRGIYLKSIFLHKPAIIEAVTRFPFLCLFELRKEWMLPHFAGQRTVTKTLYKQKLGWY